MVLLGKEVAFEQKKDSIHYLPPANNLHKDLVEVRAEQLRAAVDLYEFKNIGDDDGDNSSSETNNDNNENSSEEENCKNQDLESVPV